MINKCQFFLSLLSLSSCVLASEAESTKTAQRLISVGSNTVPRLTFPLINQSRAHIPAAKSSRESGRKDDQPRSGRFGKKSTPRLLTMVPATAAMISSLPNANVQRDAIGQPTAGQNLVVTVVPPPPPLKISARDNVPSISIERAQTPSESRIGLHNNSLNVADRSPTLIIASDGMEADYYLPISGQKFNFISEEEASKKKAEALKKKAEEKQKKINEQFDRMDKLALECINKYQKELDESGEPRTLGLDYEIIIEKNMPKDPDPHRIWKHTVHMEQASRYLNPINPHSNEVLQALTRDKIKALLDEIVENNWPKEDPWINRESIYARSENYLRQGTGSLGVAMVSLRQTIKQIWRPTCCDAIKYYACCGFVCRPKKNT